MLKLHPELAELAEPPESVDLDRLLGPDRPAAKKKRTKSRK
jgi:hypothetical protein